MFLISRLLLAALLVIGLSSGTLVIQPGASFKLDRTHMMFVATMRSVPSDPSALPYLSPCGVTKEGTLTHVATVESRVVFRYDKGLPPSETLSLDTGVKDLDGNPIHVQIKLQQCPSLVFRDVRDARAITSHHVFSTRKDVIRPSLKRRLGLR